MKRRKLLVIAVLVVSAMTIGWGPTTASAETPPAEEAFRTDLGTYLDNLKAALSSAGQNPHTADSVAPTLEDKLASLDTAIAQVPDLTADQLAAMGSLLGQGDTWQLQPTVLEQNLAQKVAVAGPIPPPYGFYSHCDGAHGFGDDQRGLFYGYWAAAQIASAANAVASGMPDGVVFTPALIIVAVIFGVANGIAIALANDLSLSQDCSNAADAADLADTLPTDPSKPVGYVQASSQISVNTLTAVAGGIKTTLDTVQTDINIITGKLTGVINLVGIAQGAANDIQAIAIDLQGRTDVLLSSIGTPNDTGTSTANGLANSINDALNTALTNTEAFQALSVRLEIERTLADSSGKVVAMFAIPASQGGYLQTVRDIVTTTISNELAAGQGVGQARTNLASANTALAAGKYQTAYLAYAAAYTQAVK